ncbi:MULTISPECIES: DarT ssDNA thymidine ADP-ribosyltransferase family protein [unclassified Agromyces]|uniref:DarT ssDNA thymidine ADP-ribosyltransferase family protein n=1 Tax=unclassified Agromyces TaxID=2639701 RepID=UPI003014B901
MGEECIHGFDEGLCAICSPPAEPDPAVAAARSRQVRTPGTSHEAAAAAEARAAKAKSAGRPAASARTARQPGTRVARGAGGAGEAPVDAGAMRLYHVTHIENLGRILGAGAILADAGDPPAQPAVDLAAPAARAFRRSATVGATGARVAEYVPFLVSTDAHVWESIRTGTPDPRLNAEAVGHPIADHVILVTSVAAAAGARLGEAGHVVVTETDAAVAGGAFAATWAEAERSLVRLTLADEGAGLRAAEVLVHGGVPLERIALVAVANDRVRDRVRAALQAVGSKTRVAVYPPWFQALAE